MSLLPWVIAGLVAYTLAVLLLDRRGVLPDYVGVQGPIVTLHTERGKAFLDRLARHRRFWRAWANFGVGVALVVMVASFVFLALSALSMLRDPRQVTAVNQPRNVLVIPGVNDFLPLSVAPEIVLGLAVGLVVHEGGHGLLCRVEKIEIDSMGLALLAFVPIGAFVEPDEQSQQEASRGGQTRMFAAGVTNNFAVTIVAFALLFGPVVGSMAVAPGAAVGGVLPNSSAARAGIEPGDRITAVDGRAVEDLESALARTDGREVRVELNGERTRTVERYLIVTAVVEDGPANLSRGARIESVEGQAVYTEDGFRAVVDRNEMLSVTADGRTTEFPAGSLVTVAEDGPMAAAGAPAREMVIVRIDGRRVNSTRGLTTVLDGTDPGETVPVVAYLREDGEFVERTYRVELGENPRDGDGFLGIRATPGVTGLAVSDFGIRTYPADTYLRALGGEAGTDEDDDAAGLLDRLADSFLGKMVIALYLPIGGVIGAFPFNFAGFTGFNLNFYVFEGPLAFLGSSLFLIANSLFWIGWINVQLAFFNCIPAFPLDGGRMLRTSAEAVVSRLPVDGSQRAIRAITTTVGLAMLVAFFLLVFGPELLN